VHEARKEFLESQLALTELRTPFAGLVLHKDIEVGEAVASISPVGTTATPRGLITLADLATLEGEVDVTEAQLPNLREGQPAEIRLDARPGEVYPGRLRQIVPTANRQKATVLVKVQFGEIPAGALPEMSVRVTFLHEGAAPSSGAPEPAPPSIPRSALFQAADGATAVWEVKDGRAVQQRIRTGEPEDGQNPDEVIVLEGLQNNDVVVVAGGENLREGLRVRVKNASRS
jgi:RND family efflux transporter MFP subunit